MKDSFFSRIFNSIFTKLLLIIIFLGIGINSIAMYFFKDIINESIDFHLNRNIIQHIHYMIDDLGMPPAYEKAKEISKESYFEIRYESNNLKWSTYESKYSVETIKSNLLDYPGKLVSGIPSKNRLKNFSHNSSDFETYENSNKINILLSLREALKNETDIQKIRELKYRIKNLRVLPLVKSGFYKGDLFVYVEYKHGPDGIRAYIFKKIQTFYSKTKKTIFKLTLFLTFIVLIVFFTIRRILRPVKMISKGVEAVIEGNLEYHITYHGNDELGNLSKSFNYMTGKINEMLKSKEQLLFDVSHELRSPLTRARLALEFLPDSSAKKSINEDILEMDEMVREILENAKISNEYGRLEIKETIIKELVKNSVKLFDGENETFINEAIPESLVLMIDSDKIKTVFNNLLSNAFKYSNKKKCSVEILYKENHEFHIIKVIDCGSGISEKELSLIFEPFYRVDKSRSKKIGGYGLGLSICKKIMEAHRGKIIAESVYGQETTMSLYFPKN